MRIFFKFTVFKFAVLKFTVTGISLLLLAACMQSTGGSSSDAPEWITGEPDMFPNMAYLTATGSASKAEQAKARALSNLAKNI